MGLILEKSRSMIVRIKICSSRNRQCKTNQHIVGFSRVNNTLHIV